MIQKVTIPEISKIAQENLKIRIANNVVTDSKNLQDEEEMIEEIIKEQLENEIEKLIDESGNSEF